MVDTVTAIAASLGLGRVEPAVLHESRHVSIRLRPHDLVARVIDITQPGRDDGLHRELAVVRHLVRKSAPVVSPAADALAGPHYHEAIGLTLWQYVEHVAADEENRDHVAAAAQALRQVHAALADFPGALPSFRLKIDECRVLLEDESALTLLRAADRRFLLAAYRRLIMRLDVLPARHVPIHGDTHLGNVFITGRGAVWNDFDAASLGPPEWDTGWISENELMCFEPVDHELVSVLSDLRSLCVSVWCWDLYEMPEKREAAEYHLQYLKARRADADGCRGVD